MVIDDSSDVLTIGDDSDLIVSSMPMPPINPGTWKLRDRAKPNKSETVMKMDKKAGKVDKKVAGADKKVDKADKRLNKGKLASCQSNVTEDITNAEPEAIWKPKPKPRKKQD